MNRDEAVALVSGHGWTVARTTKKGLSDHAVFVRGSPGDAAQDPVEPQPFPAEGRPLIAFCPRQVRERHVPRQIDVIVGMGRRLSDDEITDLIEGIVDHLDRLSLEPSVGTLRAGDDLRVTGGVSVDQDEEFEALSVGVAAVKAAFQAAGIRTAGLGVPRDLRSRVEPLQRA